MNYMDYTDDKAMFMFNRATGNSNAGLRSIHFAVVWFRTWRAWWQENPRRTIGCFATTWVHVFEEIRRKGAALSPRGR